MVLCVCSVYPNLALNDAALLHHHRFGNLKSGRNYGKRTRFRNRVFGTTTPREEMGNVPYGEQIGIQSR